MRKIIYLFLFFPIVVNAASAVILTDPAVLYFSNPEKISLPEVEKTIVNAVRQSSSPEMLWSVESKDNNVITAKLVVRNKHFAFVNIHYSPEKIQIKYKNSNNLKFEKINEYVNKIHPNYMVWVNFLAQRIKLVFETGTQYVLSSTPATVKGSQHFVIVARAEPGTSDNDERSNTTEKFSRTFLSRLTQTADETKDKNISFQTISSADVAENLFKESRDNEVSKNLCKTYNADKILSANAPQLIGGRASRYVTYYLYICSNGRKFSEKYRINRYSEDSYGYQVGLTYTSFDFIKYTNAYK